VSAAVRAAAKQRDKITFWVVFKAKANLSSARAMTTKAAKGAEVRRAKLETATASQAQVRRLLDGAGADYQSFWISNSIEVTGQSRLLDPIAARPEVASIEETRTYEIPTPIVEPTADPQAVAWGVDRIGAPQVWSQFGARGEGIVVANIDTGVSYSHPALVNKYRGRNANGTFDHNYNWFDPSRICPSQAPCDNDSHGTHTMGIMVGDDGGSNQIGVAPGAKWIAAKGCETHSCSRTALLASGQWIIAPTDLNGQNPRPDLAPDIVNNSWGGSGSTYDPWYEEIVQSWVTAGIFPAFANGNSGPACNTSGVPGQYIESYSSGAFDINNTIASFSSRGSGEGGEIKPNLAAPGVSVRSSIPGTSPNNSYASFSGTSMASPHTAGAVALIWSAAPAVKNDIPATRALLDSNALDVNATGCGGTPADNNIYGEGLLNAFAAVSNAPRGPAGALRGIITSGGSPVAGVTVVADGPIYRTTTTAADGMYSFPVLNIGDYVVSASKYAYLPASGNVTVTEGATSTLDISLTQAPTATVSGTVTAGGAPVAGAAVSLAGTPLSTVTNAAGVYSLTAPQGQYQMTVASPQGCRDSVTQTVMLNADATVDVALPVRTDAFGYACSEATGSYPSVSNLVSLTGDNALAVVELPFAVPFYGATYKSTTSNTSITVSTNGTAAFGRYPSMPSDNLAIPTTIVPNGAIYPMWDNWVVDASAGVYTGVIGSFPHRSFVIEWRNVRHYLDATQRLSFAAEIGEDGVITYRYKDVAGSSYEAGFSATIGIENRAGTVAFQYSFNQAVLTDGTAITFRPTRHGVVRGTVIDANDGLPVSFATVDFGAAGWASTAADGVYLGQILAGSITATFSSINYETVTTTLTLDPATVVVADASLRTAKVTASPAALELVVPANQTRTRQVTLTNSGGLSTPVTVQEVGGDVPWLSSSLAATSLAAGDSTTLTIRVDTIALVPGIIYQATLRIVSQSGRQTGLLLPVKLVVPNFQRALDAGADDSHVDPQGDTWSPDVKFVAGAGCGWLGTSTVMTTSREIEGTDDPVRFANARQGMDEYRCDGLANGTYTVELDFAEISGAAGDLAVGMRIFDVVIEGVEVIPKLDIYLEAGGAYKALNRTFIVTVTDGVLNILFVPRTGLNQPLVNALRVTHRPNLTS